MVLDGFEAAREQRRGRACVPPRADQQALRRRWWSALLLTNIFPREAPTCRGSAPVNDLEGAGGMPCYELSVPRTNLAACLRRNAEAPLTALRRKRKRSDPMSRKRLSRDVIKAISAPGRFPFEKSQNLLVGNSRPRSAAGAVSMVGPKGIPRLSNRGTSTTSAGPLRGLTFRMWAPNGQVAPVKSPWKSKLLSGSSLTTPGSVVTDEWAGAPDGQRPTIRDASCGARRPGHWGCSA